MLIGHLQVHGYYDRVAVNDNSRTYDWFSYELLAVLLTQGFVANPASRRYTENAIPRIGVVKHAKVGVQMAHTDISEFCHRSFDCAELAAFAAVTVHIDHTVYFNLGEARMDFPSLRKSPYIVEVPKPFGQKSYTYGLSGCQRIMVADKQVGFRESLSNLGYLFLGFLIFFRR
jgi:hypothetical protein